MYFYGKVSRSGQVKLMGNTHAKVQVASATRPLGTSLEAPDFIGSTKVEYEDDAQGMKLILVHATGEPGDGVAVWDIAQFSNGQSTDARFREIGRGHLLGEMVVCKHGDNDGQIDTEWRMTLLVDASIHQPFAEQTIGQFLTGGQWALALVPTQHELPLFDAPPKPKPDRPVRNTRSRADQQDLFDTDRLPSGIDTRPCDDCESGTMRPGERDGVSLWCCDSCPATAPWVDPLADLADEQLDLEADSDSDTDAEPAEPTEPVSPAPVVSEQQMAEWPAAPAAPEPNMIERATKARRRK